MRVETCVLALLLVVCLVGTANAQFVQNEGFIIANGSYVAAKSKATGDWVDGAGLGFAYETVADTHVSLGTLLSYFRVTENAELDAINVEMNSWLFYFYLKYFFAGNDKLQAWIAPSLGVQVSGFEIADSTGTVPNTGSSSNVALGLPIGLYWMFGEKVFLTVSYAINWMNNDIYDSGLVQAGTVGFVFKIR